MVKPGDHANQGRSPDGHATGTETGKRSLFAELKRRNVLRAATFYAASAWLIVQIATQVFPFFEIANWVVRWIVVAAAIGFPFAMAFSWFYEWTTHGIVRESEVTPEQSLTLETGRKLERWTIVVLGIAVVLLLANTFVLHRDAGGSAAAVERSIAVLPLVNVGGDKDEQYFSDGLSEDLITALSQSDGLKVIGRNSAFRFRDSKDDSRTIGARLGVAHLLVGSVRHMGGSVRVSAELIRVADGSTEWSQHYDRPYQDLFAVQDDITQSVAQALRTTLMPGASTTTASEHPPSGSLDAWNAYQQGKFFFARNTQADYRRAIEAFATATRLDPHYAAAFAGLSHAYTVLAGQFLAGDDARQAYVQARMDANNAVNLEPNLAIGYRARAALFLNADLDWIDAEADYRRALKFAPNDGPTKANLGQMMAALGRPEQAIDLTRAALLTDPFGAKWYAWLARYLLPLQHLDQAEQAARKAIELQPGAMGYHEILTVIAIRRGKAADALAQAQQEQPGPWRDIALALALQIGSDHAAADAALKNLVDHDADTTAYQIAEVYALRNDPASAFAWLDRAWKQRDAGVQFLLYDSFLQHYRSDPRFAAYCAKVGLPAPGGTPPAPTASPSGATPAASASVRSP